MLGGDETKVRIIEMKDDGTAKVQNVSDGSMGVLRIKGKLKVLKDGTVNAWVIQNDGSKNTTFYGNAYFGKFDISKNISEKYIDIISRLFNNPSSIIDADISTLKGMVNRCIKQDQWDWYTTYKYIGYPTFAVMKEFVTQSIIARDGVREGNMECLYEFRERYTYLLRNLLYHLDSSVSIGEDDTETTINGLGQDLWNRLSNDSKKNLLIAERVKENSSQYVLMHYFVTIEQEFYAHYIDPFIREKGKKINTPCSNKYLQTTHDILIGKTHFSIGAIYHLGKNVQDMRSVRDSEAVKEFKDYLGMNEKNFVDICYRIANHKMGGMTLVEIRNGLAHGNSDIINHIDEKVYAELHLFLFSNPDCILKKILEHSMKYE